MFDSKRPPFLVQMIKMPQASLFPPQEGYDTQFFEDDLVLVSFRDGWTFPMSARQQAHVTFLPLLLLKNVGGLTASGSNFDKGYAHQFCGLDGKEPECAYMHTVFHDQPDQKWMLVKNNVAMVWFQYGNTNEYLGEVGQAIETNYYGKILIREFHIKETGAPRFDKYADRDNTGNKLFFVESKQVLNIDWAIKDQDSDKYLTELLGQHGLSVYNDAVLAALQRARTV
jgi:hypothetical protein